MHASKAGVSPFNITESFPHLFWGAGVVCIWHLSSYTHIILGFKRKKEKKKSLMTSEQPRLVDDVIRGIQSKKNEVREALAVLSED